MGKDIKISTKLSICFIIIDILLIACIYAGYFTVNNIVDYPNPAGYIKSYNAFCAVMAIVMLIVTTGMLVVVGGELKKALAKFSVAAKDLAQGDINVELGINNNTEFGLLAKDVGDLVQNLRKQAEIVEEVSNGNMLVEVHPRSDKDVLGNALKVLVESNRNAIISINEGAGQVMTSSSQVASASDALAQGSTEQASAIEEITSSIDEVAQKTKENAVQANEAVDLMQDAISTVKEGNEQMHAMVAAMQDINKSSESISKIIKTIDDIAFQTNILALNAAVEAARAGEAGKGFAVVAEEVRNLAAKSAAAAAETAELIEDSINKVEVGSQIAGDTANALVTITEVVGKSEQIVISIAEASNYQATAVAQIDQAIGQVSQVVQTNSATSEECAAASEELYSQAERMKDLLSAFNVGYVEKSYEKRSRGRRASVASYGNANEQIISLGDGFGKY